MRNGKLYDTRAKLGASHLICSDFPLQYQLLALGMKSLVKIQKLGKVSRSDLPSLFDS
jgi:hypothetical protein